MFNAEELAGIQRKLTRIREDLDALACRFDDAEAATRAAEAAKAAKPVKRKAK